MNAIKRAKAQKKYRNSQKGVIANKRYNQSPKGKTNRIECVVRHQKKHPEQAKARYAVAQAVVSGKLFPPQIYVCVKCQKTPAQHYHHYLGYSKHNHLDVIPICAKCHKSVHFSHQ